MSLIEGVGDEVTVVVTLFLLACLVLLAWFSTHTRDIPFVSVIVVELSQRRNRTRNREETAQRNAEAEQEDEENVAGEQGEVSSNNNADTVSSDEEQPATAEESKTDAAALRSLLSDSLTSNSAADSGVPSAEDELNSDVGCAVKEEPQSVSDEGGAEEAAAIIPEFKPERESTDEVRRRRVAYFENARDDKKSDQEADVCSVGAQLEESSPSAQTSEEKVGEEFFKVSAEMSQTAVETMEASEAAATTTPSTTLTASPPTTSSLSAAAAFPSCSHDLTPSPTATDSSSAPADPASPASGVEEVGTVSPGQEAKREGKQETVTPDSQTNSRRERSVEDILTVSSDTRGEGRAENADAGGQQIRVRLKYLNDTQRLVYADPQETVGNFRRLHFSSELEDNKIVRFIFNGQDLRNDLSTLRAYNIADNSVVHCLITQSRQNEAGSGPHSNTAEDDGQMGAFLYPVFGLILGLVWYLRFSYKQYFNAMSTVSLAGVSFIYLLALFSSMRHRRQPHVHLD